MLVTTANGDDMFFRTQSTKADIKQGCISLANQGIFNCSMSFGSDWGFGSTITEINATCLQEAMTLAFKSNITMDLDMSQELVEGTIYNDELERTPLTVSIGRSILQQKSVSQNIVPFHMSFMNYKLHLQTCINSGGDCKSIDIGKNYIYNSTGLGVKIYVVGEGIRKSHIDFSSLKSGVNRVIETVNTTKVIDSDCAMWQGTHVAALASGLVHGVAKDSEIISVAVKPGCRVRGKASDLIKGFRWISTHLSENPGPAVIFIGALVRHRVPEGLSVSILGSMITDLSKSAVIVSAAGAFATDACLFTPASIPEVITVAAAELLQLQSRPAAIPWDESNYGGCVDIWGPGVRIESAFSTSDDDTALYSGTTQAAASVAGVCAQIMQSNPKFNVTEVRKHLLKESSYTAMLYGRPDTPIAFVQSDSS